MGYRIALVTLCVATVLIGTNQLAWLVSQHNLRSLLASIGDYIMTVVSVVFYFSVAAFAWLTYLRATSSRNPVARRESEIEWGVDVAGTALAALLAMLFVIAIAMASGVQQDLPRAALIWFLFVLTAGLVIDVSVQTPLPKVGLLALAPSVVFLVGSLGLIALAYAIAGTFVVSGFGRVVSGADVLKTTAIASALAVGSWFGIVISCYSRSRIFELLGRFYEVPEKKLTSLRRKVNIVLGILTSIGAFVLGFGAAKG